jgi:hypothetical protein
VTARVRLAPSSTGVILAGAVALSFVVRVLLTAHLQGPWIFPDELGYEQVAANLARGHLALYGNHGLSYSPFYPLLLAPLYASGLSASDAHEGIKAINAALMSLALLPAYGIARFMLPRGLSLVVVGLAAVAPLMYLTSLGMSENLAYPLFLLATWLLLRTLGAPSRTNDALLLGAIVLACAARIQLVALVPGALTALLVVVAARARERRRPFRACLVELIREHTVFVGGCIVLVLVVLAPALTGSGTFSAAGRYSDVPGKVSPSPVHAAKLLVYHTAGLVFVAGVIPFIGALAAALVWLRRGAGERAAAFAGVGIGLTAWLLIETAYAVNVFESEGDAPRIHERYLFYLMPLFLTALVVAVRDDRVRRSRLAFALATTVGVLAVLAIPFQTDINGTIVADSFSFEIFARNGTLQAVSHATVLGVCIVAILGGLLFALRGRLPAVVMVTALFFVFMSYGEAVRVKAAADGQRLVLGPARDWVDRADPAGAVAMVVGPQAKNPVAEWQTDYHNLSIRRLFYTCKATLSRDFGERRVSVGADGVVRSGGQPLETAFAVVPVGRGVEGRVLGRDPVARLELVATDGTLRVGRGDRGRWRCPRRPVGGSGNGNG